MRWLPRDLKKSKRRQSEDQVTDNDRNNGSTDAHGSSFSISCSIVSNEKETSHDRVPCQARSFDKEFAAPVGWVRIENRLRERPRMSPWVEERALAFAIHVIRGFSEYTSTGCLGA
jgi:hypothetical protein